MRETAPATAQVSIVTGCSRGIGRQIALRLAPLGHRLVLVARDAAALEQLASEVRAQGAHDALPIAADLRDALAPARIVAATRAAFGEPTLVVNNAGTAPSDKIEHTTAAIADETFNLHVRAPLLFAREVVGAMKAARAGCLLQLASTAGLRGFAFTAAYTAAKHGMVGLSRALHAELSQLGIAVYALCPGFVDTEITQQAAAAIAARGKTTAAQAMARMAEQNRIGRMHSAAEVAAAAVHLLTLRPAGCVYDLDQPQPGFVDPATH